jgi:hypothetical protein
MSNIFDGLQETAFNIVTNTMGYPATWQPSTGELKTANVLFKDATQTAKLLELPYDPKNSMIEYKQGDFNGLKEAVDSGKEPVIEVNGIQYGVMEINTKYDGKTIVANITVI